MSAVDRINAVMAQSFETAQDKRAALMAARASEFSGLVGARDITRGRYGISILKGKVSAGQVELFARVFRDGVQIGFGADGSVDVERFVVVNPPLLVKDNAGDVMLSRPNFSGKQIEKRYRIDPLETVCDSLEVMVRKAGKLNSTIVPGKEGRTTYTIYSNGSDDGYISSSNATYATARSGSNLGAVTNSANENVIGQTTLGDYYCFEAFVNFTTSTVAGSVSSATLSLYGASNSSNTDFTINARRLDYTAGGLTTADWIAGASVSGQALLATYATTGWDTADYNVFTSQAAFLTNINQSGTTGIILSSSRHEGNNAPTGDEYVIFHGGSETGTSQDPRLVIEATLGFTRSFTGPFWGPFRGPFG